MTKMAQLSLRDFWHSIVLGLICLLVLWSSPPVNGYVKNILGTPYLYLPQSFVVNPDAPRMHAPEYQRVYGYRGREFMENINQRSVEGNPKLYDVEDSRRLYHSVIPNFHT